MSFFNKKNKNKKKYIPCVYAPCPLLYLGVEEEFLFESEATTSTPFSVVSKTIIINVSIVYNKSPDEQYYYLELNSISVVFFSWSSEEPYEGWGRGGIL